MWWWRGVWRAFFARDERILTGVPISCSARTNGRGLHSGEEKPLKNLWLGFQRLKSFVLSIELMSIFKVK